MNPEYLSPHDLSPAREALITHLRANAVRSGERFVLRSGAETDWYVDARQTTFDGEGARLVGVATLEVLDPGVTAIGGMTMGADPIAVATALTAVTDGWPLRAFSIRKEAKDHGTGGRLVGPVRSGDRVTMIEDTTTTGGAFFEAMDVAEASGLEIAQAISLVDRSEGQVGRRMTDRGVPYIALVGADLLEPA